MVSKIRALAYEKRMTIAAVERAAGISNGSISKWDKHAPKADSLRKVAEVLGTTSDFLLSDDELPPETKKAPVPEDEGLQEYLELMSQMTKEQMEKWLMLGRMIMEGKL